MANEITVPRLGWTMEEGTFVGWLKRSGEQVRAGDPLFTLEGEKATQDVEATESGVLHIAVFAPSSGGVVKVGAVLGYLLAEGESPPSQASEVGGDSGVKKSADPAPLAAPLQPPPPANQKSESTASPRARRAAMHLGVDLVQVTGTGRTGRIRERDVLAARTDLTAEPSAIAGRSVPISAAHRTLSERMLAGVNEAAPVTLNFRADATELVAFRTKLKASATPGGPVVSFTDILLKLIAAALREHPLLTAQWRKDELFFPSDVHLALAVDTNAGLVAPVLRNVPALSLDQVSVLSRALIERARTRQLTAAELQGGTFTLTNLGAFGVEHFTPILNLPQSAILGMGAIRPEPVMQRGEIVMRDQLPLSLTFDHRVLDGAPAARFLVTLRDYLNAPHLWMDSLLERAANSQTHIPS